MTHQVIARVAVSVLLAAGSLGLIGKGIEGGSKQVEYGPGDVLAGCILLAFVALMWW